MSELSSAYAGALFELACEENISGDILSQSEQLLEILKTTPEFVKLLSAPTVTSEEKLQLTDNIFADKLNRNLLNFIKVMIQHGDTLWLAESLSDYEKLYNKANNIEKATAITAVAMGEGQLQRLKARLDKVTGKNVVLTNKVDPGCIGGVVLQFSDKQYDSSISHKLRVLKDQLADING